MSYLLSKGARKALKIPDKSLLRNLFNLEPTSLKKIKKLQFN